MKIFIPVYLFLFFLSPSFAQNANPILGEKPQKFGEEFILKPEGVAVEVWAENLEIPWSFFFLPDGDVLVAERKGFIVKVSNKTREKTAIYKVPDVKVEVDAGLMGMAKHPEFPDQPYIYIMHTYENDRKELTSKIVRLKYEDNKLSEDKIILDHIPAAAIHLGGRIAFGQDGMLYIGTGDLTTPFVAQDTVSLASKILRITADGDIPKDNPFSNSPVYSYGHRVVQGFAWHPDTGMMFSSEHGPSGAEVEGFVKYRDEVNIIQKGKNYGYPIVVGAPNIPEYEDPILMWNEQAFPPAGMIFYKGDLFLTSLMGQTLMRIIFEDDNKTVKKTERWFAEGLTQGTYGRMRDVTIGPDGYLYVCTSNTDGRADTRPGDDKILRIKF
jgi:glucose/arabinose dehydrogenase